MDVLVTTDQDAFTEAFAVQLRTLLPTLQVFAVDVDVASPTFPYTVLYPIGITQLGDSMEGVAEDGMFNLQISTIGETTKQAEIAADRIFSAIFVKTGSTYTNDFGSQWRQVYALGYADKSGDDTFRRDDTYQFRKEL